MVVPLLRQGPIDRRTPTPLDTTLFGYQSLFRQSHQMLARPFPLWC